MQNLEIIMRDAYFFFFFFHLFKDRKGLLCMLPDITVDNRNAIL